LCCLLLRYTDSDYPFGIFKLFLANLIIFLSYLFILIVVFVGPPMMGPPPMVYAPPMRMHPAMNLNLDININQRPADFPVVTPSYMPFLGEGAWFGPSESNFQVEDQYIQDGHNMYLR
jgi:hypothetical protein